MYRQTRQERYREAAHNAINWVLDTIRPDGVIPYILPGEYADPKVKNDPENDFNLWDRLRYTNVTYVGEGIASFDLHCDNPAWRAELHRKFRPVIEFVLRTQNADGTWGTAEPVLRPETNRSPWNRRPHSDRRRSAGVINVLTWWYQDVEKDPRVLEAVRRFDRYINIPANAAAFGLLHRRPEAPPTPGHTDEDVATALTGRAIADILSPGIDTRW